MRALLLASCVTLLLGFSATSSAQVTMSGSFKASQACPATAAIRSSATDITLQKGQSYPLIARNRAEQATHYLIRMEGVTPPQRWVAMDCGAIERTDPLAVLGASPTLPTTPPIKVSGQYVLAISWQPAFCETAPSKKECKSQTTSRFDATHFTLHGLWPDRASYCNVPKDQQAKDKQGDWSSLPIIRLSQPLQTELHKVMPGTQSLLDRHEWIKHGTCYGTNEEQYYADSLKVLADINQSAVRDLFATNIGQTITSQQIRAAFDQTFGKGVGERVKIACKQDGNRRLITEMTVGLNGSIATSTTRELALASRPVDAGCPSGIVDPVGLQ